MSLPSKLLHTCPETCQAPHLQAILNCSHPQLRLLILRSPAAAHSNHTYRSLMDN